MTLAVFIVLVAVLALLFILRVAVTRGLQVRDTTELGGRIQPIDVEAFRNLANPAEREYLRQALPSSEFRRVQRARLRAMAAYVQVAARNAALLIRIGETALAAGDPHTVQAARELVSNALMMRRNATLAMLRIYAALVWPDGSLSSAAMLDSYEQLSGSAMLLGRLQNPAAPVRLSAR